MTKTLLLVDDDSPQLEIGKALFEAWGFRVLTANSCERACAVLADASVDLVLLDYMMPGMDGEATAAAIRELHPEVNIVLYTGCEVIPKSVLQQVSAVLRKGDLLDSLRGALERMSNAAASVATAAPASSVAIEPARRQA